MRGARLRIRPGNPRHGERVRPEDFYEHEGTGHVVFEHGISVELYAPVSRIIVLDNNQFCVVYDLRYFPRVRVCLPENVNGREILFMSPTVDPIVRLLAERKHERRTSP